MDGVGNTYLTSNVIVYCVIVSVTLNIYVGFLYWVYCINVMMCDLVGI